MHFLSQNVRKLDYQCCQLFQQNSMMQSDGVARLIFKKWSGGCGMPNLPLGDKTDNGTTYILLPILKEVYFHILIA